MPRAKNPALLAINDLTESIKTLKLEKVVEEAILELITTIKKLYQIDNEIVSLLPASGLYDKDEDMDKVNYKYYKGLIVGKLANRAKVLRSYANTG